MTVELGSSDALLTEREDDEAAAEDETTAAEDVAGAVELVAGVDEVSTTEDEVGVADEVVGAVDDVDGAADEVGGAADEEETTGADDDSSTTTDEDVALVDGAAEVVGVIAALCRGSTGEEGVVSRSDRIATRPTRADRSSPRQAASRFASGTDSSLVKRGTHSRSDRRGRDRRRRSRGRGRGRRRLDGLAGLDDHALVAVEPTGGAVAVAAS